MPAYDAIVLGTGGVGSAALMHLARRGARVVGIDRFAPPHSHGSSHGHTRAIRQAYFEHSNYVPLLMASYRLWDELGTQTQRTILRETGLVEIGPADGAVIPGVCAAADEHGLRIERMTSARVSQRWPGLVCPADMEAVFEARGGIVMVEEAVAAHLQLATAAGAELRTDEVVEAWHADQDQVIVETAHTSLTATHLVITAGAWAAEVLHVLAADLHLLRKSLFWFASEQPAYQVTSGLPVFLYELPTGIFYGFPAIDSRGVKVAEHDGGRQLHDPLQIDRAARDDEREKLVAFLAACLPGVSHQVADHSACIYTMTADHHFLVDCHPQHPNVLFAAGLCGHGFKFTPALGQALAEMVLDGKSSLPIDFLSRKAAARRRETQPDGTAD